MEPDEEATPATIGPKPAPVRDRLSIDEIQTVLSHLTADEMLKLSLIERRLVGGTSFSKGDLVHEAICKGLLGHRKWPRDVPTMAWIVQTMKSLASHARSAEQSAQQAEPDVALALAAPAPTPEEAAARTEAGAAIAAITAALADDEEAQLVLLGWADGLRGKPLRELVGCDQAKLDYAIKRVRQKAMFLYPDGWLL